MIPLMAQGGYRANGWLGLLLGTALWYPIFGLEDADAATFEAAVDPIVGAIGDRAQVKHRGGDLSEDVPPKVAPARTVFEPTLEDSEEPAPTPTRAHVPAPSPRPPAPAPTPARTPAPAPTPTPRTPVPALAATPAIPNRTALAPVAPDAHSFTPSMQVQMSPISNAPSMPCGSAQQVAGSPLGQRLDGDDLERLVEIMNEQRQHMTELTHMVLAREDKHTDRMERVQDKHTDRMERVLQLQNESASRSSSSTPGQTPPTEQQQHQGRQAVSNTHDDVGGTALVALMGALGLPGWLIAHRAWLRRIVVVVVLLRWRPLLRLLSRLGGV
jgi:hypothetical protein